MSLQQKINVEYSAHYRFLIRYLMYYEVLSAVTIRQTPILDSSFYRREITWLAPGLPIKWSAQMQRLCHKLPESTSYKKNIWKQRKTQRKRFNLALIYGEVARIEQQLRTLKLPHCLLPLLCFVTEAYCTSSLLYLY